jgi:hypothetical protein
MVQNPEMRRRFAFALLLALCTVSAVALLLPRGGVAAEPLPTHLSDRAFWRMVVEFSEPNGFFRSDNLVSNETTYQQVIPALAAQAPGGAYLGVGPDQNFTYIAALAPRIAFIVDIRRQNMIQLLLYKALIEMSDDRAAFLSRLFSRPRPPGLGAASTAEALFDAYAAAPARETLFLANLRTVEDWLVKRHRFPLTDEDRQSLEYVYRAFFEEGPDLRYTYPRRQGSALWFPSYAELMMATDSMGTEHSYVATEQSFRALRAFERNNLLVPVVGDFAGDKAIRAVGSYLTEHGATVNYVYTSNVEQYLFQSDAWRRYYANIALLPLSPRSTFIRSYFDRGYQFPPGIVYPDIHSVQLLDPVLDLLSAVRAGQLKTYDDLVGRSR